MRLRTIALCFLALVGLVVAAIAALPSLLSTQWGKQKIFRTLKTVYDIDAKCDRLSLSWFGHQEIINLVCDTPRGDHFECDSIQTESTLVALLLRHNLGHLSLDRPTLHLTTAARPAEAQPVKPRSSKIKRATTGCTLSLPFSGTLSGSYGKLVLQTEGVSPISLGDIQFELNNVPQKRLFARATCNAVQNATTGSVHIDATCSRAEQAVSIGAKDLPTAAIDEIVSIFYPEYAGMATSMLGKSVNFSFESNTVDGAQTAALLAKVQAPLLQFSLNATYADGVIEIREPLHAQMKITRELSRLFLKEVNPLSISYLYSQGPVTVDIPVEGFSLACAPFSIENSTIPSARINLGKIACSNEGNVNTALDLLKAHQFDNSQELLLWFAPLDLHLSQGTLDIERTEILLANTFDIALWGQLYFPTQDVDMTLGLTAQALNKAFGIKNLPEDYVLTIPMTGKTDNVKINTTKATAKVALLLATQQKILSQKGGSAGALIGGLLKQMATLPDNEDVPPAKHPFPWE